MKTPLRAFLWCCVLGLVFSKPVSGSNEAFYESTFAIKRNVLVIQGGQDRPLGFLRWIPTRGDYDPVNPPSSAEEIRPIAFVVDDARSILLLSMLPLHSYSIWQVEFGTDGNPAIVRPVTRPFTSHKDFRAIRRISGSNFLVFSNDAAAIVGPLGINCNFVFQSEQGLYGTETAAFQNDKLLLDVRPRIYDLSGGRCPRVPSADWSNTRNSGAAAIDGDWLTRSPLNQLVLLTSDLKTIWVAPIESGPSQIEVTGAGAVVWNPNVRRALLVRNRRLFLVRLPPGSEEVDLVRSTEPELQFATRTGVLSPISVTEVEVHVGFRLPFAGIFVSTRGVIVSLLIAVCFVFLVATFSFRRARPKVIT